MTVKLVEGRPRKRAGAASAKLCTGRIVEILPSGQALVDFPGNSGGAVEALSTVLLDAETPPADLRGATVLLCVGATSLPVIVGLPREALVLSSQAKKASPPPEVVVDGKTLTFDAKEQIVLRCGSGSITLKKDGTIVVLGTHLVSRSSGANKIKGATVAIN
jgi:hypothetical protein